jgi:hypothetical protein
MHVMPAGVAHRFRSGIPRAVVVAIHAMGAASCMSIRGSTIPPIAAIHVIHVATTTADPVANAAAYLPASKACGAIDVPIIVAAAMTVRRAHSIPAAAVVVMADAANVLVERSFMTVARVHRYLRAHTSAMQRSAKLRHSPW